MDVDVFKDLREVRRVDGRDRREEAGEQFQQLAARCKQHGYKLKQNTDAHYTLSSPLGWRLEIYPGNCRIWAPPGRNRPHLKLPKRWTLAQVVDAAIDLKQETKQLSDEESKD